MWKIVDGREWVGLSFGRVTVNTPKQSLHHIRVHEKCVYFSKTVTALTQTFWIKVKPAMFLFYQFYTAIFVLWGQL